MGRNKCNRQLSRHTGIAIADGAGGPGLQIEQPHLSGQRHHLRIHRCRLPTKETKKIKIRIELERRGIHEEQKDTLDVT